MNNDNDFDFLRFVSPHIAEIPVWVQPYTVWPDGKAEPSFSNMTPWVEFGIQGSLRVDYTPAANYVGADVIVFTLRDRPTDGTTPLVASTAAFQFRFNLAPVNDAPVALDQVVTLNASMSRQGLPYMGRLRYYDAESPPNNLTVFLDQLTVPFNASTNVSYTINTASGRVTLLPSTLLIAADGSADALVFLYEPAGGTYAASDSFSFSVFDGQLRSTAGRVFIEDPFAATSGGLCMSHLCHALVCVSEALGVELSVAG